MSKLDVFKIYLRKWKGRIGSGEWTWGRLIYFSLFFASSIFIAFILVQYWSELIEQTNEVHFDLVLLAVVLYPLGMLPTALSWHIVLDSLGVDQSVWFNLRAYSISTLPRKIPGSIWFFSSRASLYKEVEIPVSTSIAATIIEALLLSLTGIGLAILLAGKYLVQIISENPLFAIAIPVFTILMILIVWAFSNPGGAIRKLIDGKFKLLLPRLLPTRLFRIISMMSMAWIGGGALLFITVRSVEILPVNDIFKIIGIWAISGSISLIISLGISFFGLREIALAALLGVLIPPISAIVVAIAFRIVLTLGELIWAFVIIVVANWKIKTMNDERLDPT